MTSCEELDRKTPHQLRVEEFMKNAQQEIPNHPTMPDEKTRLLRAKLIYEEAMETINLGLAVQRMEADGRFVCHGTPNLVEIADGCADVSVVTVGTLSACGIADKALLEEVDRSNLAKFKEPECPQHGQTMLHSKDGQYRCTTKVQEGSTTERCGYQTKGPYRREDGKWVKGPDWKKPDIEKVLADQMPKVVNPLELITELARIIDNAHNLGHYSDDVNSRPNRHRAQELLRDLGHYHEQLGKRVGDVLIDVVKEAFKFASDDTPQEIDTFDTCLSDPVDEILNKGPVIKRGGQDELWGQRKAVTDKIDQQEIRVGSAIDNDGLEPVKGDEATLGQFANRINSNAEWVAHKKSGQVAPYVRTGDPSSGVLGPQPSMTLCGFCKTPLSQNLVRKVKDTADLRPYKCPECQTELFADQLVKAD